MRENARKCKERDRKLYPKEGKVVMFEFNNIIYLVVGEGGNKL